MQCPAYGHKCGHCDKFHHVEDVCRSKCKPKVPQLPSLNEQEGAIFDTLCTIRDVGHSSGLPIDHHVYDDISRAWHRQRSKPQPYLTVTVQAVPGDYQALGFNLSSPSQVSAIPAMADTGCQSCLAGLKVLHRLGLRQRDLIPVTMEMHTATNGGITILGAVPLRLSGKNPLGHVVESRQLTYVTDSSDKLFLSKEACIDLGLSLIHI